MGGMGLWAKNRKRSALCIDDNGLHWHRKGNSSIVFGAGDSSADSILLEIDLGRVTWIAFQFSGWGGVS